MSVSTSPVGGASPASTSAGTVYVSRRRGLSLAATVTAAGLLCALGALGGGGAQGGLGVVFDVSYVLACLAAGLLVDTARRRGVLVLPPLLYAGGAVLSGVVHGAAGTGSVVLRQAENLMADLIMGAPWLVAMTLLVTVTVTVRGRSSRRRQVRSRLRAATAGVPIPSARLGDR